MWTVENYSVAHRNRRLYCSVAAGSPCSLVRMAIHRVTRCAVKRVNIPGLFTRGKAQKRKVPGKCASNGRTRVVPGHRLAESSATLASKQRAKLPSQSCAPAASTTSIASLSRSRKILHSHQFPHLLSLHDRHTPFSLALSHHLHPHQLRRHLRLLLLRLPWLNLNIAC